MRSGRCIVCGKSLAHRRAGAKTCENAHRQKLYRQNKLGFGIPGNGGSRMRGVP